MHWSELPLSDQIFTHFEEQETAPGVTVQRERTFAASALRRFCERKESVLAGVVRVPALALNPEHGRVIEAVRGLEPARLLRALVTRDYQPLLFVVMPDDSALLIDGSHTYCAMLAKRQRTARAYLVPECIWRGFLVEGLEETTPEKLLASWSGVR